MDIAVGTVIDIHLGRTDEGELLVSVNDREILGATATTTPRNGGVHVHVRIEALREGSATVLMKWNDEMPLTHDIRVVSAEQAAHSEFAQAMRALLPEQFQPRHMKAKSR